MLMTYPATAAAVLVTGRYPRSTFGLMVGGLRWFLSVAAYVCLLTDAYPPFSPLAYRRYPARLDCDYPEGGQVARWRPLVCWVLVAPQMLLLGLIYVSVCLMILLGLFSITFTQTYPAGVFDFIVRSLRFHAWVSAYALFLTDSYPKLAL
jgi:hypothetical protein